MKTAGLSFDQMQALKEEAHLHDWMEWFFERYAPKDPYDRYKFHADLFSLIQRTYCTAQAPLLDRLTTLAGLATPRLFPRESSPPAPNPTGAAPVTVNETPVDAAGGGGRSGMTSAVYGPGDGGDSPGNIPTACGQLGTKGDNK